ncbi:hypothetical protein JKP88DRAFT_255283, partial [Tribonema minus]
VAHDLGTPLTTFSLGLQLLQEDADITPAMRDVLDMQEDADVAPAMRNVLDIQALAMDAMNAIRHHALDAAAFSAGHRPIPTRTVGSIRVLTERCVLRVTLSSTVEVSAGHRPIPTRTVGSMWVLIERCINILSMDLGAEASMVMVCRDQRDGSAAAAAAIAAASRSVIEWEWSVHDGIAPYIATDFSWVQDMVLQLLNNAKKHAVGTGRVVTTVAIDAAGQLRFTVRDFGAGVAHGVGSGMFDKFK